MFGMGMGELIVILVVALLFLGPDKLPDAAKSISKGIRDFRKQTRELQESLEGDEEIGSAIRDLKSALRGDELAPPRTQHARARPPKPREQLTGPGSPDNVDSPDAGPQRGDDSGAAVASSAGAAPAAQESMPDDDMPLIRPPTGSVTRGAMLGEPAGDGVESEKPDTASGGDKASDREEAHG